MTHHELLHAKARYQHKRQLKHTQIAVGIAALALVLAFDVALAALWVVS